MSEVLFSKDATKALKNMPSDQRRLIGLRINGIMKTPPEGDIKHMQGMPGHYRLRVGQYRIIYHFDGKYLKIDKIGARGDIYK